MAATSLDDVTLYVPARNAEAWLASCVTAIGALDPAPREVLVIYDTESSDDTVSIARALPNVRAVPQTRRGLTAARNIAFGLATTRWVASVDSDVLVAPDWLGVLWNARNELGSPAAISGRTEERVLGAGDAFRALMMPHHWGAHAMRGPFMTISDALFDREAVLSVGGYRESLERYGDDSRLSQDLRDAGYALAYTPHARALHIRQDSVASVLDLRWAYSEPRQRPRLMDLEGLKAKLAVNTEYGRMTTARALEAGEPVLAWIGAVLPVHHALADCAALLEQRTLMSAQSRRETLQVLRTALSHHLLSDHAAVASVVAVHVPALFRESAAYASCAWPAFNAYVEHVVEGLIAWCDEVGPLLDVRDAAQLSTPEDTTLKRWAALLGGPDNPHLPGSQWPAPRSAAPWRQPARQPTRQAATLISTTQTHARHSVRTRMIGGHPIAAVALEGFDSPRAALCGAVNGAQTAGLSYTMPTRLKVGTEILLAIDLAEACAAENLAIVGFETLAGGVELWAERVAS